MMTNSGTGYWTLWGCYRCEARRVFFFFFMPLPPLCQPKLTTFLFFFNIFPFYSIFNNRRWGLLWKALLKSKCVICFHPCILSQLFYHGRSEHLATSAQRLSLLIISLFILFSTTVTVVCHRRRYSNLNVLCFHLCLPPKFLHHRISDWWGILT